MPGVDEQLLAAQLREDRNRGTVTSTESEVIDDEEDEQYTARTLRSSRMADSALKSLAEKNAVAAVALKTADMVGIDVFKWFKIIATVNFILLVLMIFGIILAIGYFITIDKWELLKSIWIYISPYDLLKTAAQSAVGAVTGK